MFVLPCEKEPTELPVMFKRLVLQVLKCPGMPGLPYLEKRAVVRQEFRVPSIIMCVEHLWPLPETLPRTGSSKYPKDGRSWEVSHWHFQQIERRRLLGMLWMFSVHLPQKGP